MQRRIVFLWRSIVKKLAAVRKHQLAPIPSGPFSANQVKTRYAPFSSLKIFDEGPGNLLIPVAPDRTYKLTDEKTAGHPVVAKDIYDAAKNAGVPLGPLPPR